MQRSGPKSSTVSRIHGRICATVQRIPKMHSIPKILIATLSQALAVARARFQVSWPSFVRSIGQPITGSMNVRIAGSHGRELGQLGPENFDLAAQVAATEQSEAILPNGVGQEFGPRRVTEQQIGWMPAEMLTDGPNALDRGVEIEGALDLGAREVDQADHALRPTSRVSQLLRPPHLAHGIVGNELRPYSLDDAQSVDVPCVILGKVYHRQ